MNETRIDTLIAGGGIAGLLLARALRARGQRVLVANDPARSAALPAAAGLLHPSRVDSPMLALHFLFQI